MNNIKNAEEQNPILGLRSTRNNPTIFEKIKQIISRFFCICCTTTNNEDNIEYPRTKLLQYKNYVITNIEIIKKQYHYERDFAITDADPINAIIKIEKLENKFNKDMQTITANKAYFKLTYQQNQYNINENCKEINSCGVTALYMIQQCLTNKINIQTALLDGCKTHKEKNQNNNTLFINQLVNYIPDLNIDLNGIDFGLTSEAKSKEEYENNLTLLSNEIVNNNKIGALFLKGEKYHSVIIEKVKNETHVMIADSHGNCDGHAFVYKFNTISDGANFLSAFSPYRNGPGVELNSCSFCPVSLKQDELPGQVRKY